VMSGAAVEEIVRRQADEIRTSGHLDWAYPGRGTQTPVPET
jgi:hypothetical protein